MTVLPRKLTLALIFTVPVKSLSLSYTTTSSTGNFPDGTGVGRYFFHWVKGRVVGPVSTLLTYFLDWLLIS